jgi:hypothetical protein
VISAVIILGQSLSGAEMAGAALVIVAALLEGSRGEKEVPGEQCLENS